MSYPYDDQQQQQYYYDDDTTGQQQQSYYYDDGTAVTGGYQGGVTADDGGYYNYDAATAATASAGGVVGNDGMYYDPNQFQQEQAYYDYSAATGGVADASTIDPQQSYLDPATMSAGGLGGDVTTSPIGSYYLDGLMVPQTYGYAVSALAYDTSKRSLYISTTTQPFHSSSSGRGGGIGGRRRPRGGGGILSSESSSSLTTSHNYDRSSLLMTYSTRRPNEELDYNNNTGMSLDGGLMYSTVAGHPEASSSTLQSIYQAIYGIGKVVPTPPSATAAMLAASNMANGRPKGALAAGQPPNHSYRPPYGAGNITGANDPFSSYPQQQQQQHSQSQKGHMGINDLLPLHGTDGYVVSVSPASVRIHSYGGVQVSHTDANNDVSGSVNGMVCGTIHPYSAGGGSSDMMMNMMTTPTHVTVGGIATTGATTTHRRGGGSGNNGSSIHCMDLWQGLRTVRSLSFKNVDARSVAVTAMTTSQEKGSIVAGCSDGNIRLVSPTLQELATIKSSAGGVSSVAISPDGMLIATTGYSSKAKPSSSTTTSGNNNDGAINTGTALYAFPDTTVYVYDIRYLGRGGIPHPFTGVKGAPRHLAFVPNVEGLPSNRLLVSSGRRGGGVQIITPFEFQSNDTTSFFVPPLDNDEFVTALSVPEDDELAFGTSMGRVLTYRLHGYSKTQEKLRTAAAGTITGGDEIIKSDLPVPPYIPTLPEVSLPPQLLQGDPALRNGTNDQQRNIFSTYVLYSNPVLTPIGESPEDATPSFGTVAVTPIVEDVKRNINKTMLSSAVVGERDYILSVPMSSSSGLDIDDIFANHNTISKRYKGTKTQKTIPNPNKFLFCPKLASLAYEDGWHTKKKEQQQQQQRLRGPRGNNHGIPARYQMNVRPTFRPSGTFDASNSNDTGLFPGWDYSPSQPNAWACPVLLMLYFIPEVRRNALDCQLYSHSSSSSSSSRDSYADYERALTPELGFIFDQIDSLSRFGLLYPAKRQTSTLQPRIGTWTPTNFISFLSTMPEAEQLQVLDSSPSATDHPRRPESFYRFLAYQMDKEISSLKGDTTTVLKLMDSLNGLSFVSSNQFIESSTSQPTHTTTRALTLDLNYDIYGHDKTKGIRFGRLLQHSLCRETRLRAWNSTSKAYETIIQRKIATSLPQVLTLSCSCAGRKADDGLWAWRSELNDQPFLPEFVDVELKEEGAVVVTEYQNGMEEKFVFENKSALPKEVSKLLSESTSPQKKRYRLDAVLSYISNSSHVPTTQDDIPTGGHHVLHARVTQRQKDRVFRQQAAEAKKVALLDVRDNEAVDASQFVLSSSVSAKELNDRADQILGCVSRAKDSENSKSSESSPGTTPEWILFNGSNVSSTVVEDARAFHVAFKQPVLVIFRAVNDTDPDECKDSNNGEMDDTAHEVGANLSALKSAVENLPHLSSPRKKISKCSTFNLREGRPVAFDAEFVAVQEEDSSLNEAGQKVIVRETRHAIGRVSVLDCNSTTTMPILDDHVLPRERVVDYLTRFSGITPDDLDARRTKHSLISTRSAYLELRYILATGSIFVGHGLKQDFSTLNIVVPPNQIIDTVELFHIPGMRYVSLRFLANFVLKRDMQQDTHDSVEDAVASYGLFKCAQQWKKDGIWDQKLHELYASGEKTQWKVEG